MPLFPSILPALDAVRGIPAALGMRPTKLVVLHRTWSGGIRNRGVATDEPTATLSKYPIRHVSEKLIASSGGRYVDGDVIVKNVTPYFPATATSPAGGYTLAQLDPPCSAQGVENVYRLSADQEASAAGIAGDYRLIDIARDRAGHFTMHLRALRTTPTTAGT